MSEPFIGEIRMVGFGFAPPGWLFCQGQILSTQQYQALFAVLGTAYGGNGTTTFGLPDLRGRSPVGMGNGPNLTPVTRGQMGGVESTTIDISQMPSHTHVATGAATTAMSIAGTPSNATYAPSATNNILGASPPSGGPSASIWSDQLNNPVSLGNTASVNVTLQNTGGSTSLQIRNPYVVTNFIIAHAGLFPQRN